MRTRLACLVLFHVPAAQPGLKPPGLDCEGPVGLLNPAPVGLFIELGTLAERELPAGPAESQDLFLNTTTVLPLKCHSERPKGAKNLVPGWQFAAVKRDCFVAEFILSLSKGSSQ